MVIKLFKKSLQAALEKQVFKKKRLSYNIGVSKEKGAILSSFGSRKGDIRNSVKIKNMKTDFLLLVRIKYDFKHRK